MDCYTYKVINNCETPLLKNVDVVLILAMEDSTRFKEDPFLLNLTKQTIIQYNKGFKKCNKPSTIKTPKEDIVHAYYTAFEYLKEYNNVMILEDDALVVNKDLLVYEKIDTFIATTDFDIFTFGSFGLTSKYSKDFFKFDKSPFNLSKLTYICSQANIYSYNARTKLIEDISSTNFNRGQMDSEYLAYLDKVFTYKYPLIVQLFPQTENMKLWCNNIFHLHIVKCIIALFKLDSRTYGWYLIYFICRNFISIITLIIIILIISIHYFKVYNMKLVKTNKFII
jgi:hypothetical protein